MSVATLNIMIKYIGVLVLCLTCLILVTFSTKNTEPVFDTTYAAARASDSLNYDDGPYILIHQDSLIEHTILKGDLKTRYLPFNAMPTDYPAELSTFKNVSKIAAFSDLHGQYDLTLTILKNNNIIDEQLNWAYGDGHLVIVGDIFDRGSKVTELLWFFYNLETQAEKSGGMVHYLLGNHEYMVMQNDLRYINPKYSFTSKLLNRPYDELFGKQSVLGRWLRSKATILKINDIIFVHGGISEEFIANQFDLERTNRDMRHSLVDTITTKRDSVYNKYFNSDGPIWYRGYFSNDFRKKNINKILRTLHVKHIVVGHTSQMQITSLFKKKILAVDSSIKLGKSGDILLIENGNYFRSTMDGTKIPLD